MFNQITLEHCPGLTNLLGDGERIEELMKLSPEASLLRWVNHQLEKSGTNRRCANFASDITDSEVYSYLLKQIAPMDAGVTMEALRVNILNSLRLFSLYIQFMNFNMVSDFRKKICCAVQRLCSSRRINWAVAVS